RILKCVGKFAECINMRSVEVRASNYDKAPVVAVPGNFQALKGWPVACRTLKERLQGLPRPLLVVDTYPGVNDCELLGQLETLLRPALTIRTLDLKKDEIELMPLIGRNLTEDRIFGVLSCHKLEDFFNADRIASARRRVQSQVNGLTLIYGVGAGLVCG